MPAAAPSSDRLTRLRWGRRAATAVLLAGLLGLTFVWAGRSDRDETAEGGGEPQADAGQRSVGARTPPLPPPPAEPRREVPTRPLRLLVSSTKGPVAGVYVRAIEHDEKGAAERGCAAGKLSDAAGAVTIDVEDPAPPGALIELAKSEATGLRHGLVPLAQAMADAKASPRGVASVTLPEGGSLRVALEGFDPKDRPRTISLAIFAPYGEWASLFKDLAVVPAADGGLIECGAVPPTYTFAVGDDGVAVIPHVPSDLALSVSVPRWPEGYIVVSATSTTPAVAAVDGEVLRVLDGIDAVYRLAWRRRPEARVRVLDDQGNPIEGARIAVGIDHGDGKTRLFDPAIVTDASGTGSFALWTGSRLPEWKPAAIVIAATAAGRSSRLLRRPGRWYGVDEEIRLAPGIDLSFVVEGRLTFPNGRSVQGVPIFLAAAEPWNGHVAAPPITAKTGDDGSFRFSVSESLRELFAFGSGIRIAVDGERLEEMKVDALWRSLWPGLQRGAVEPASIPLPLPSGTAKADGVVVIPP